MTAFHVVIVLGAMVVLSMAEIFTLSLGNIGQYSASLDTSPTLTGSCILFTEPASPNDGVDVVLSNGLRTNIAKTMESNCKIVDNQCVESIKSLLSNRNTELEARQVAVAGAALLDLIALAIPWYEKERSQGVPVAVHIPSAQLDPAASAAQASTIVALTGTGVPFVTITPKPESPSVTNPGGSHATILSSTQDGHSPGDHAIHLSDDLASRLTEMIQRSRKCADGDAFHGPKPISVRDTGSQVRSAICVAEQILLNVSPSGPFANVGQLEDQLVGQTTTWSSEVLVNALEIVAAFSIARANYMHLRADASVTLSFSAFLMAYQGIFENKLLTRSNYISWNDSKLSVTQSPLKRTIVNIPTTMVTIAKAAANATATGTAAGTGTPTETATTSSSASTGKCRTMCTMVGIIKTCQTTCPTGTKARSTRITGRAVKMVSITPCIMPVHRQVAIQAPLGVCSPDSDTDFPTELFTQTYPEFCKQAEKSMENLSWTVNAKGKQITHKSRRFKSRYVSVDAYKHSPYRFTLSWRLQDENTPCSKPCSETFDELAKSDSCKRGSDKKSMAATGNINIGCGTFSYSIDGKPAAPKPSVVCHNHPLSAPKHDSNASGATSVDSAIQRWCSDNNGQTITQPSPGQIIYSRFGITELGIPNRSSFWLRASLNGSNKEGKVVKDECITALTDAITQCDPNSDKTHGVTASVGAMDYALDLSGVSEDHNPPWVERPSFPPPAFVPGKDLGGATNYPICYTHDQHSLRPIHDDDIDKAIDAFCVDGAEIKGLGKNYETMFLYPPKSQPRFYNSDTYKPRLALGAETVKTGAKDPYDDMAWCSNYGWKMARDDCRFAFRKLLKTCNTRSDKFIAGDYTYRCVHYTAFGVTERD